MLHCLRSLWDIPLTKGLVALALATGIPLLVLALCLAAVPQ